MSLSFHIRLGRREDLVLLPEIERAAAKVFPVDRVDPYATRGISELQNALTEKLLWIAETKHQVIGFALCCQYDTYLNLREVSVHPDFSQQGVGRTLLSCIIENARLRESSGVTLTTFSDFQWNAPFYRSLGFEVMSTLGLPAHLAIKLQDEKNEGLVNRVAMILTAKSDNGVMR